MFPYSEVCTTTTGAPHDPGATKVATTGKPAHPLTATDDR